MVDGDLQKLLGPYLDNDLIKDANQRTISRLSDPHLDEITRSVDLIIRGLRRNRISDKPTKRNAGNFSSSIMISRGWLFLDYAHFTSDVNGIVEKVYTNTATGDRTRIIKDIKEKTNKPTCKERSVSIR